MKTRQAKNRLKTLKTKRLGRPATNHTEKRAYNKPLTSLQKARAAQKAIKAKLVTLKADFKAKLKSAIEDAYAKAHTTAIKAYEKKSQAKQKILNAAEAKFEKKYAKKLAKMTKTKRRKKHSSLMSDPQNTTKKTQKVGRPKMKRGRRAQKV